MSKQKLNTFEFLLSDSKTNHVSCEECGKTSESAHLYCIKLTNNRNKYIGKYKVGCTHMDYDGESWCDNCYTIANKQILCKKCGCLKWGSPSGDYKKLKYMWIDGSES